MPVFPGTDRLEPKRTMLLTDIEEPVITAPVDDISRPIRAIVLIDNCVPEYTFEAADSVDPNVASSGMQTPEPICTPLETLQRDPKHVDCSVESLPDTNMSEDVDTKDPAITDSVTQIDDPTEVMRWHATGPSICVFPVTDIQDPKATERLTEKASARKQLPRTD